MGGSHIIKPGPQPPFGIILDTVRRVGDHEMRFGTVKQALDMFFVGTVSA